MSRRTAFRSSLRSSGDDVVYTVIGGAVTAALSGAVLFGIVAFFALWSSFIVRQLWGWYILPTLEVPVPSYKLTFGALLIIGWISRNWTAAGASIEVGSGDDSKTVGHLKTSTKSIGRGLLVLFVGYVGTFFF